MESCAIASTRRDLERWSFCRVAISTQLAAVSGHSLVLIGRTLYDDAYGISNFVGRSIKATVIKRCGP